MQLCCVQQLMVVILPAMIPWINVMFLATAQECLSVVGMVVRTTVRKVIWEELTLKVTILSDLSLWLESIHS